MWKTKQNKTQQSLTWTYSGMLTRQGHFKLLFRRIYRSPPTYINVGQDNSITRIIFWLLSRSRYIKENPTIHRFQRHFVDNLSMLDFILPLPTSVFMLPTSVFILPSLARTHTQLSVFFVSSSTSTHNLSIQCLASFFFSQVLKSQVSYDLLIITSCWL